MTTISKSSYYFDSESPGKIIIEVDDQIIGDTASNYDEHIPLDSGVIDVEAHGITPFVGPMDPQLWVDMVTATVGIGAGTTRVFYFKYEGVYEFTNRLPWEKDDGTLQSGIEILGKSRDGTIIRLQTHAQGYENPYDAPRSFIRIDSQFNPSSPTNNAFWCSIRQCTIEIGAGNPAAVAIEHNTNNIGHVRNVRIRSEDGRGITGIGYAYRGYANGPTIVKNCIIEGFDYAVSTGASPGEFQGSITLEDIDVIEPNVAGFSFHKVSAFQMRNIRYSGRVPGVYARGAFSAVVILDSEFTWTGEAGDHQTSAIHIKQGTNPALTLIRNVQTTGFKSPILENVGYRDDTGSIGRGQALADYLPGTEVQFQNGLIGEYLSPAQPTPPIGSPGTLGLPVEETPELIFTDPADFVSIESFGATRHNLADAVLPASDSLAAIQAAIDSGKPVVYAQGSTSSPEKAPTEGIVFYGVSGPIRLRGSVQKFMSLGHSCIVRTTGYTGPIFIGEDGSTPVVELYGWWQFLLEGVQFQFDSSRSFLMRNILIQQRGVIEVVSGTLFLEDVSMGRNGGTDTEQLYVHAGARVFGRHFNPETNQSDTRAIFNDGGDVWIMGYKTEVGMTIYHNQNGGRVEILGGYHQMTILNSGFMIINDNGQHCVALVTTSFDATHPPDPFIREVVGTTNTDISKATVKSNRPGVGLVLYTGQKP